MNLDRIDSAVKSIRRNARALSWLQEHGTKLTGDDSQARFELSLYFAGGCVGAEEAAAMLESYARLSLAELVQTAIKNCNNTIAMDRSAIAEELGKE